MMQEHVEHAASGAAGKFNPGELIMEHVSNSSIEHPLLHLPKIAGIDLSVTKHVLMLWVVAALLAIVIITAVRRYLRQDRRVPSGMMNALEYGVEFVRDGIVAPNVGRKWVNTWTPLVLTFFLFILTANAIGLVPIFELLAVIDRFVLHTSPDSFLNQVIHGGTTVTGNFNVTAALATISFG